MRKNKKKTIDDSNVNTLPKLNDIAVKFEDVEFTYREDSPNAVDKVSFEIKNGEYTCIIGHNGSGKSTISKIMVGVLRPQSGRILMYGNEVNEKNIYASRYFLGIIFQNPDNQFIGSTVRDDIAFGLENRMIKSEDMPEIISNAAKEAGVENLLDHEPMMLSGGQKQRVAIASTLALNPDIMIFDESTSMLDPKGKNDIKQKMLELKKKNKTIISITHDMDELLQADKIIVLNKGKLVKIGKPTIILSDQEFLKSIHLDIPFIHNLISQLNLEKSNFNFTLSENNLLEQICQKIKK
ncbi:energy-coupling factor transporter ATPase [Spiroplasma endosymbiont of Amphibalanus improvisus]|uniref:energy-coupling factor transporter ATPase n=1 Tax=Spiroplasma endosymbiont of Amphibalanus improvisus TaxID=3066327 RepID=UPI00313D81B5